MYSPTMTYVSLCLPAITPLHPPPPCCTQLHLIDPTAADSSSSSSYSPSYGLPTSMTTSIVFCDSSLFSLPPHSVLIYIMTNRLDLQTSSPLLLLQLLHKLASDWLVTAALCNAAAFTQCCRSRYKLYIVPALSRLL